jgi:hypothetical protein
MAWNPSPKLADCRDIATKWGRPSVVIIAWDDEQIEVASFGATKQLCAEAEGLAEEAYNAILKAYAAPGQTKTPAPKRRDNRIQPGAAD